MKTTPVSPIELQIGDRVMEHGAIVEVMAIFTYPCDPIKQPNGVRVAACISRLVGDDMGAIPRGYFDTPQSMRDRGCTWGVDLPDGYYWNVQGNALARVHKVVSE